MKKVFKYIFYLLIGVIILVVIGLSLLVLLFDPNDYKAQITQYMENTIQREVTIEGPIQWSFYPVLGIELDKMTISNPANFKSKTPFAYFKSLRFGAHTLPLLFKGEVKISQFIATEGKIHLIRNKNGRANWTNYGENRYLKSSETSKTQSNTHPAAKARTAEEPPKVKPSLAKVPKNKHPEIPGLPPMDYFRVKNTQVTWTNHQSGRQFNIGDIDIEAHDFNYQKPFDLHVAFTLPVKNNNTAQWDIETTVNPNLNKATITFQPFQAVMYVSNSSARSMKIRGHMALTQINTAPQMHCKLNIKGSPKKLSQLLGYSIPYKQVNVITKLNYADQNLEVALLNGKMDSVGFESKLHYNTGNQQLHGHLNLSHLDRPLPISQLNAKFNGKNNQYTIKPITAKLFQGQTQGNMAIDLSRQRPHYEAAMTFSDLHLKKMFKFMEKPVWITGTLSGNLNLHTSGSSSDVLYNNIQGNGRLRATDGKLIGYDFLGQVKRVLNFARLTGLSEKLPDIQQWTPFDRITSDYQFTSEVFKNNSIKLENPFLTITGKGEANLNNYQLYYKLLASPKFAEQVKVPMILKGNYHDPKIHPDFQGFLNVYLKQIRQAPGETGKKIYKQLKELSPF